MGFGTELWDQVPAVEQFSQDGQRFNSTMIDFFDRTAKDTKQISKDMMKLVESCMPTSVKKQPLRMNEPAMRSTLLSAWMGVLTEKQNVSERFLEFSNNLDRQVIDNLRSIARDKEVARTRLTDDVKRMREEMQAQFKRLDEARVHYEKKSRKAVDARRGYERIERQLTTNRSDLDKARATMDRRQSKASASEQSYRRIIVETNERQRRYFQQDLRDALDNLQQLESDRIIKTKEILTSFIMCELTLVDGMKSSFEQMLQTTKQIDHERDVNNFIADNRTGEPIPEDLGFVSYNPSLGRAPTYGGGGASTTKGGLLGKRELQASDLDNMPSDRQVKVLQGKIKELELEKVETEKRKIDAELRMADVGPTESYQQDQLRSTLDTYSRNISHLEKDIYRYQEWLDRVERGESIMPTPMTNVNLLGSGVAATPTVGGFASSGATSSSVEKPVAASYSDSFGSPDEALPMIVNPEFQNQPNVASSGHFEKQQKQRGFVDRMMGSIFHPREP